MLRGEPIWHTSSTGPMSMPSSSEAVATSALRSPARSRRLDPVAALLREAAVVGGHHVVAQALAELVGEPLGQPPGVDEHERGAVLGHELGDAVEHVAHLLGRRDRLELAVGQLEGEVEVALVADVDDRRQRPIADQQPADRLDRPLGGRQPDADRPPVAQRLEALEAEGQVRAPLVAGHGVDLVDDHGLDRAQRLAAAGAGDQQVERLGGGDHEARRSAHHEAALRSWWCRRCAPRPGCRARRGPARRRRRRSRRAAARGSRRCRRPAP